ncbi:hypothetical protein E3N88_37423 [Mikania micrantha]|uniref:Uncharacterized protein n=1 Tax=Mikania micrantha TaxID=192012 RepID=A0A5N6LR26_9ASTR|nr:hypothetical protein E3N88_37423 [Mikania micrantha]
MGAETLMDPLWNFATSSLPSYVSHPRLPDVVANMKKLRWIYWEGYPSYSFPINFEPTKLGCLTLIRGRQVELWQGYKHLPNLKILDIRCSYFLTSTPNFSGLPCLERLILEDCINIIWIDPSIGYHERLAYLSMNGCSKLKMFPSIMRMEKLETLDLSSCPQFQNFPYIGTYMDCLLPQFPRFLRQLDLSWCDLGDGDIPSDISGLFNLQVLYLCGNKFSRLDSRLSRIPCLKLLNLSWCTKLVELPDLPSSIAILQAEDCDSLQSVGDLSGYKCLWKVSLWRRTNKLMGGERLLHSMLQVNALEDRFMSVQLPRGPYKTSTFFNTRRLITLQLPDNWYNDFSGFLFCADDSLRQGNPCIIVIKQEMSMDSQPDQDQWEEFDKNTESYEYAHVGYVPFGLLRRTPFWNSASYTNVTFEIDNLALANPKIGLVPRRSVVGDCPEFWEKGNAFGKTFEIIDDPKSTNVRILWHHGHAAQFSKIRHY